MAFLGEYNHTIDPKNRVFIPAKFRDALGESFVVCKAPDECLFIYSNEGWDKLSEEINNLPPTLNSRQFQRDFFRNADTVEADKQGRITLKSTLKDYAGLLKDVVIVGAGKRIEIWNKDKWDENAEKLSELSQNGDIIEVHY